jgi:tripartite motif-containing protein 71
VYVADDGNNRIQKFDTNGSKGTGYGQFDDPTSAAVDSSGNVYVADFYNYRIQVFSPLQ